MKKITIILAAILLLQANRAITQIVLDTVFEPEFGLGYDFFPTQISPSETKYVFCDFENNTFSLYNMNFTPFMMDIPVPEPFYYQSELIFQVMYITRTLFDCDSTNIEFAYQNPTGFINPFYVVRTDETVLLKVDSANGPYCIGACQGMSDFTRPIRNTSDGAKLFLQKPSASWSQRLLIYSLCGELATDVFDFAQIKSPFVSVFPNPASNTLTFQITLPDNMNEYELVLLDSFARVIKRQNLSNSPNNFTVDISSFNDGIYLYTLSSKDRVYKTGKFIVKK